MSDTIIDTVDLVRKLIEDIENSQPCPPFIFMDLEGVNLSRHGSVAIMQVLVPPVRQVHLVDVHTLKALALETPSTGGLTLKAILESEQFPKVFFDVRNDSDALYSHFQIKLSGVVDLQLLEFATRGVRGKYLKGLSKCISETTALSWAESREWREVKEAGQKLFDPEQGGRYEVFHERPLPLALVNYCVQDVLYMPKLLLSYAGRLQPLPASQVQLETISRILLSQSPHFNGKGRHMAVGPTFASNRSATQSTLPFPMSVVCSTDLAKHCTLRESNAVDLTTSKENAAVVTPEPTNPESTPEETVSSLSEALELMMRSEQGAHGKKHNREDEYRSFDHSFQTGSYFEDDSAKDFTACGSDCDWCGHCDY